MWVMQRFHLGLCFCYATENLLSLKKDFAFSSVFRAVKVVLPVLSGPEQRTAQRGRCAAGRNFTNWYHFLVIYTRTEGVSVPRSVWSWSPKLQCHSHMMKCHLLSSHITPEATEVFAPLQVSNSTEDHTCVTSYQLLRKLLLKLLMCHWA